MVQGGWQLRLEVVRQLLQGALSASEAARRLRCSARTLWGGIGGVSSRTVLMG